MHLKSRIERSGLVVAIAAVVLVIAVFMLANVANAALWPKNVRGWIRDNEGNPVNGASVTINIRWESDDTIRSTYTATSGSDGFYSKSVLASDWDEGDTIQVIATYKSSQQSNETVADANPVQFVNVTYPFAIPEFGPSFVGLIAAGAAIGGVAVALLVYFKRK